MLCRIGGKRIDMYLQCFQIHPSECHTVTSLYPFAHHMPVVEFCHTPGEDTFITVVNRFIVHCRKGGIRRQITDDGGTLIEDQRNTVFAVPGRVYNFPCDSEGSKKRTASAAAENHRTAFVNGLVKTVLFLCINTV